MFLVHSLSSWTVWTTVRIAAYSDTTESIFGGIAEKWTWQKWTQRFLATIKIDRVDIYQFLISVHNQSIAQWEFYCFCFILIKDLDSWFIYQNQNNSSILCLYSHCRNIVNFISIWHFLEQNIFFFAKEVNFKLNLTFSNWQFNLIPFLHQTFN